MKNIIKIIISIALSLLILVGVVLSILNIVDIYTLDEVFENLLKSFYIILTITIGLSLISFITSIFNK